MLKITLDTQEVLLAPGERLVIGTARSAGLRARGGKCAAIHLIIEQRGDRWYATDADTKSGSYRNGERFERVPIDESAVFTLGSASGIRVRIQEFYSPPELRVAVQDPVSEIDLRDEPTTPEPAIGTIAGY